MTDATKFLPDPDAVEERKPAACPFCGHDGAFDGQGAFPDTMSIVRAGVQTRFETKWYQHRCPECNGRFQTLDEVEKTDVIK